MDRWDVPGAAIGVWHEGETHFLGLGVTNIEFPQPVDPETLFQIGSTTKTFTGTIAMQLVEEGVLDLDAPVRSYLPAFRLQDEAAAEAVRIGHLVTHLGGWRGDYFDDTGRGNNALSRGVRRMRRHVAQLTPVGSLWHYNNAGFHVLGRVIEVLCKKPYEQVVSERILTPLGLSKSFFFAEDIITHKTALGHIPSADRLKVARPWGLPRLINAAGGLTSNVIDQIRYARFHLGHDLGPEARKVLARRAIKAMQRPRHKIGGSPAAVGVTWMLDSIERTRTVRHGGSINGQMSAFMFVPKHDFAITVLTNSSGGTQLNNVVTEWALEKLLGLSRPKPQRSRLRPADVARYAGTYELQNGLIRIAPNGRHLMVHLEFDKKARKEDPSLADIPERVRIMLTQRDRFIVLDEPWTNFKGDFVRDETGEVAWFRVMGRIHRRLSDDV